MAWGNFVLDKGYDVVGAITKFRFVKYNGVDEQVTAVTANTDVIAGVSQFGVTAAEILRGKGGDTRILGISEVEAAGACTIGQMVQMEADGRVTNAVGASGKRLVGKCVGSSAANAGDRCSVLIIHGLGVA